MMIEILKTALISILKRSNLEMKMLFIFKGGKENKLWIL